MTGDAPTKRRLVKLLVRGDGQAVLELLEPGAPLILRAGPRTDPETPVVQVLRQDGAVIGTLASSDALLLAPYLDGPEIAEVTLHHLTGGTASHPGQEAQIGLRWQGQEARAALPLTEAQRAWRARHAAPDPAPARQPRRAPPPVADGETPPGPLARLRALVSGYYSGQLTWKMTFVGIILSTITMTAILILLDRT